MQRLQGIAVSPGVAIGEALVMGNEGFRIPRRFVARDAVDDELRRLDAAFTVSAQQIQRNCDAVSSELGREYGAIFEAHLQMLNDARLRGEMEQLIRERHYSPEYAVSRALRRYVKVFQSLDNNYLAERANDIVDIEKRLLRNLLGRRREEISSLTSPVLVLAHNLTPSEVATLDREFVRGLVTEEGGSSSHTAIVAQGLEIPAVVGTGSFLTEVSGGDVVIIDGDHGQVILQPDEETIARYRHDAEQHRSHEAHLATLRDLPAETADGAKIELLGNIEFPHEVRHCLSRGAAGIGLYRTEFLYLGVESPPDEEGHFRAYSAVVQAMGNRPVVIRTFDLGADKAPAQASADDEKNPFLGLRSTRLALRNLPTFRTQLRAILRASAVGNVRIMFPLIATILELRQAKMVLADVVEDLEERGEPFNRKLPVGMMVEVPSAVMMIDHFAEEVDFLSIGTNDLIQYTLAVDRSNKDVADLYSASDPAVLKLIKIAVDAANRHGKPINLCGQMSGNSTYTMLLLGLGLRQMSVAAAAVPEIKRVCRSVTLDQCRAVAERSLAMENARDVTSYLKEELRRVLPDMADVA
ncbi:MAG: phosphoenolpyruvate--protein phosphotransferase [Planctomycetia bacterium]|nr:phosphoenolpyruvate--protein phosphotransferase [Planctomycetia bacterium]